MYVMRPLRNERKLSWLYLHANVQRYHQHQGPPQFPSIVNLRVLYRCSKIVSIFYYYFFLDKKFFFHYWLCLWNKNIMYVYRLYVVVAQLPVAEIARECNCVLKFIRGDDTRNSYFFNFFFFFFFYQRELFAAA